MELIKNITITRTSLSGAREISSEIPELPKCDIKNLILKNISKGNEDNIISVEITANKGLNNIFFMSADMLAFMGTECGSIQEMKENILSFS